MKTRSEWRVRRIEDALTENQTESVVRLQESEVKLQESRVRFPN